MTLVLVDTVSEEGRGGGSKDSEGGRQDCGRSEQEHAGGLDLRRQEHIWRSHQECQGGGFQERALEGKKPN